MQTTRSLFIGITTLVAVAAARGDERRFTYVYEPETPPAGMFEVETWFTVGLERNTAVGQEDFRKWQFRQELEYGVTDRYAVSLYLNETQQSWKDPATGSREAELEFKGFSLENRYNFINPAEGAVGLTGYLEGTYWNGEAELEAKIILGQRHGLWKWAFNLEYANEWEDDLSEIEGEFGASFGIARDLGKHWSVGLELRDQTLSPDYSSIESNTLFLGPVVSYRRDKWWAALTFLPQIKGWNLHGDPDGDSGYELNDHEKFNLRLLVGFNF